MRKKPKTEQSDTTGLCHEDPGVSVWKDPELKELAELTDKILKVPKAELDKLEAERPKRNRRQHSTKK